MGGECARFRDLPTRRQRRRRAPTLNRRHEYYGTRCSSFLTLRLHNVIAVATLSQSSQARAVAMRTDLRHRLIRLRLMRLRGNALVVGHFLYLLQEPPASRLCQDTAPSRASGDSATGITITVLLSLIKAPTRLHMRRQRQRQLAIIYLGSPLAIG
jgi:hypothetical protein